MTENKMPGGSAAPASSLSIEQVMQEIPEDLRPLKTAKSYPHITAKFAELWRKPGAIIPFFDSLLMDDRGGRQGFPLSIIFEIQSLKDHYLEKQAPQSSSSGVWSHTLELEQKTRLERGG